MPKSPQLHGETLSFTMTITVVRPGELIPARVFTLDPALQTDANLSVIHASLSSPTFSYGFDKDVNDPTLIIAQHRLPYPERLKFVKADLQTKVERHEHDIQQLRYDIQQLHYDNQQLQDKIQELERERQANLTIQLQWEMRSRIAQALNDTYVQNLLQQEEYANLKANGHNYLPVVLSSWAVFTNREPATRLIDIGVIDDEEMGMHLSKGVALRRDGLEESIEFVWGSIPTMERDVMILMFLTRPSDHNWIAHPVPTVGQGRGFIDSDSRILQSEQDYIKKFIPMARDKSKKRLFSSEV